jgi:D-alanyl-D-alanine carboxypeptidase
MRRGGRHVIGVVLGGTSGASRDARMRQLVETEIASAAPQRTIAKVSETAEIAAAAAKPTPQAQRLARADAMGPVATANLASIGEASPAPRIEASAVQAASAFSHQPRPGSAEPISPLRVKTISVKAGSVQSASLAPLTSPAPAASVAPSHFARNAPPAPQVVAAPAPVKPAVFEVASASSTPVVTASTTRAASRPRGPWLIQIGAFPKETEAQERLREAQAIAKKLLAKADPFTERVTTKGNQDLYRARFAGLEQSAAEAACRYFKRNDIACMTIKNN